MNAKTEKAFRKADAEFLKLSTFSETATIEELQRKKIDCIEIANELLEDVNKTLEETEYANMLLNFAQCELAGIDLPRH
jgi:hypothetical protein